jgi:hypothetical protein
MMRWHKTTGEFVGVSVVAFFRIGNANAGQHLNGAIAEFHPWTNRVAAQHIANLFADLANGVQRRAGILKNHRQFLAAQLS